jgi:(p)ppGpp synthase/HD superfamily hydrolase
MEMKEQELYQEAIKFAAAKHEGQTVPGTKLPYVVHLSNVAMEIVIAGFSTRSFNLEFAIQVALLHDTLEDTTTKLQELEEKFGGEVARAVSALTKNKELPKEDRMMDSLSRIKELPSEVWAIKLADRITNLQSPPDDWSDGKRIEYQEEARVIGRELRNGNEFLVKRLEAKIEEYGKYIDRRSEL